MRIKISGMWRSRKITTKRSIIRWNRNVYEGEQIEEFEGEGR